MKPGNCCEKDPFFLIVGADGIIGEMLFTRFRQAGSRVLGTTRRRERVDGTRLHLDLADDVTFWQPPPAVTVAVICAGVTNLGLCSRSPDESARVNVEGISTIVKKLVEKDILVVYLSTNQVFDGSVPYRQSGDSLSAITEYGRQKAEAERRMGALGEAVAIVRLTKVLGPENSLFSAWAASLKRGEPIHPFSDMVMAPVPLSCAVSVIDLISRRNLPGLFHLSGNRDISYAEAACLGAKVLGADTSLVQPVSALQSGLYAEIVPAHTTLDIERLRRVWGIEPPDVEWTIEAAFARYIDCVRGMEI